MTASEAIQAVDRPTLDKQSLLDRIVERQADVASRYQPVMDIDAAAARYDSLERYIKTKLVDGVDYGRVPGVEKPFLFKAGAQKLCILFGYVPHYTALTEIEDWSGADHGGEPLFYYKYNCTLYRNADAVGEGIGSANSWESKYRYRWVQEEALPASVSADWLHLLPKRGGRVSEPEFAIKKGETGGKYGKPVEYWQRFRDAIADGSAKAIKKDKKDGGTMDAWEIDATMFRVPNDQFPDVINTCQKQAEKRAYVEATLRATGASQFFTQDEDAVAIMNGRPSESAPSQTERHSEAYEHEEDRHRIDAGSRKVATVEASTFPPEIDALFKSPLPPGAVTAALTCALVEMNKAFPDSGADEYRAILEKNGIERGKKQPTITQARNAACQCWTLATKTLALKSKEPTSMSDMPYEEEPRQDG